MLNQIKTSAVFRQWLRNLRDRKANAVINIHIKRMLAGNLGNVKSVGKGILEKKIYFGSGYRLYFTKQGSNLIFLLCGGDKSTQGRDIKLAQEIAKEQKYYD
jgi:putative addiction module killer protein